MMIALVMLLGASISAAMATAKYRNVVGWMIAGALFPLLSIVILACKPRLDPPVRLQPPLPTSRMA